MPRCRVAFLIFSLLLAPASALLAQPAVDNDPVARLVLDPRPDDTRLFLAPTGRPLRRGDGYFSDHWVFFPGMAYGVTDHFTLAGGMSFIPGLEMGEQFVYFTPKAGIRLNDHASLSVGGLLATWGDASIRVGYAVTTFGTSEHGVTAGMGVARAGDGDTVPIAMIGGAARLSKRIALVSENWFLPGGANQLFSGGVRLRGDRLTVDLAVLTTDELIDEDGLSLIPWLSFAWHFGGGTAPRASSPR